MSNQILIDLYKEASEFAYKICKEEGRTGGPTDHIWNTLSTGKFAELIVRECMLQCIKVENDVELSDYEGGFKDGALLCYQEIQEHFGVEE